MNWLQCILYGLFLGFGEFIPVPNGAQMHILQQIFGSSVNDPLRELLVHIFSLAAFFLAWRNPLDVIRRDSRMAQRGTRIYNQIYRGSADSQFVRTAAIPMLISMIVIMFLYEGSKIWTMIILLINGIILYLPERMLQGNKTAKSMSPLDGVLIGLCSALSVIPGMSRVGLGVSVGMMRGADRKHTLNWAYLLSVPALLLLIGGDLFVLIFASQTVTLSTGFGGYLLLSIFSFAGAYLSVFLVRNFIIHRGLHAFAYYSWGAAMFYFILYLL